jgi:hypothetical protein
MKGFDANDLWRGMPDFVQEKKSAFRTVEFFIKERKIICRFDNQEDVDAFVFNTNILLPFNANKINLAINESEYLSKVFDQKITNKTKSIWYPYKSHW